MWKGDVRPMFYTNAPTDRSLRMVVICIKARAVGGFSSARLTS